MSLSGVRAISDFTYSQCEHTVEITVHDYEADPDGTDPNATTTRAIRLVVDGQLTQDTDFGGNGNEGGTVTVTGDFVGSVESRMVLVDEERGGVIFGLRVRKIRLNRKHVHQAVPSLLTISQTGPAMEIFVPWRHPMSVKSPIKIKTEWRR